LIISVTIVGEAPQDEVIYRDGGKDGDALYVTGFLGDAALGLNLLERGVDRTEIENPSKKYLCPTPRVREGRLLAKRRIPNAMIDISDGLLADLDHIVHQSSMGAEIELPLIPLSSEIKEKAAQYGLAPLTLALGGGDDYELLFTISPEKSGAVDQLREEFTCPITRIGKLSRAMDGIMVKDEHGNIREVQPSGYDHFKAG
jgi:thiamine-monophosphate kinase